MHISKAFVERLLETGSNATALKGSENILSVKLTKRKVAFHVSADDECHPNQWK